MSREPAKDIVGIVAMVAGAVIGVSVAAVLASILYGSSQFIVTALMLVSRFPLDMAVIMGIGVAVYAFFLGGFLFLFARIIPRVFLHGASGGVSSLALWITLNQRFDLTYSANAVEFAGVPLDAGLLIVVMAGGIAGAGHRLLWTIDVVRVPLHSAPAAPPPEPRPSVEPESASGDDLVSWSGGGMPDYGVSTEKRMSMSYSADD